MRRFLPTFLLVCTCLSLPAAAHAATASVVDGTLTYGDGVARLDVAVSGNVGAITITDKTAPPVAGAGCTVPAPQQVTCAATQVRFTGSAEADFVDAAAALVPQFDGGAGADTLSFERDTRGVSVTGTQVANVETVVGTVHADVLDVAAASVFANAGNDVVRSRALDQLVDLGEGDDVYVEQSPAKFGQVVSGGPGRDRYEATGTRREAFEVCLDERTTICRTYDGRKFERDKVGSDVEDVRMKGTSHDLLIGSPEANTLEGGGGNDILAGGRGADTLRGGAGLDVATFAISAIDPHGVHVKLDALRNDGSPKHDFVAKDVEIVSGTAKKDKLIGGPGLDALFGEGGNDTLIGGKGPDLLVGGRGNDYIDSRDGVKDELECGPGTDRIRADLFDTIRKDCEFRRFS